MASVMRRQRQNYSNEHAAFTHLCNMLCLHLFFIFIFSNDVNDVKAYYSCLIKGIVWVYDEITVFSIQDFGCLDAIFLFFFLIPLCLWLILFVNLNFHEKEFGFKIKTHRINSIICFILIYFTNNGIDHLSLYFDPKNFLYFI
jgi:hypothetical protein